MAKRLGYAAGISGTVVFLGSILLRWPVTITFRARTVNAFDVLPVLGILLMAAGSEWCTARREHLRSINS